MLFLKFIQVSSNGIATSVHVFNPIGEADKLEIDDNFENEEQKNFHKNGTTMGNGKKADFSPDPANNNSNVESLKERDHLPLVFHRLSTVDENEEVSGEEEVLVDLPPPPDGGWGWVIVLV